MELLRPSNHVAKMGRHIPGIWQRIDRIRSQKHQLGNDWPPWCFFPVSMAEDLLDPSGRYTSGPDALGLCMTAARVTTLAAWRTTQGVYRFDPTIFEAVWETPLTGDLPVDLLFHSPEWCCYIETPGRESPIWFGPLHGFFAWLNYSADTEEKELFIVLDCDSLLIPWPRSRIRKSEKPRCS
jgi:hypothetical protein